MNFFKDKYFRFCINSVRIYGNYIVFFVLAFFIFHEVEAQIPLEAGDFRTIASGDFDDVSVWEMWDGANWVAAL